MCAPRLCLTPTTADKGHTIDVSGIVVNWKKTGVNSLTLSHHTVSVKVCLQCSFTAGESRRCAQCYMTLTNRVIYHWMRKKQGTNLVCLHKWSTNRPANNRQVIQPPESAASVACVWGDTKAIARNSRRSPRSWSVNFTLTDRQL